MKPLSKMSLEELWQLFPIFLKKHQDDWKDWYMQEEQALRPLFPSSASIHHIGSTAIDTIWAKPIVDILVELPKEYDMVAFTDQLLPYGYSCMSQAEKRISFRKGYTMHGFAKQVFHLHLRYQGDHDELYFRDYLIEHPDIAHQYETLKLRLWKEFEHNRDAYTDAKSDFVKTYSDIAKSVYQGRYE